MLTLLQGPRRAQRAIFSRISTFLHLKSQNFLWPAGACAQSGPGQQQMLEHLLDVDGHANCWKHMFH